MIIRCPKCNNQDIFKRSAVPRIETHTTKVLNGNVCSVRISEPKFYVCCKCGHKFNIK